MPLCCCKRTELERVIKEPDPSTAEPVEITVRVVSEKKKLKTELPSILTLPINGDGSVFEERFSGLMQDMDALFEDQIKMIHATRSEMKKI